MPSLSEYIHAKHKGDLASLEAVPNHYDVSFESMQVGRLVGKRGVDRRSTHGRQREYDVRDMAT